MTISLSVNGMKESNGNKTFFLNMTKEGKENYQVTYGVNYEGLRDVIYRNKQLSVFLGCEEANMLFLIEHGYTTQEEYDNALEEVELVLDIE